MFVHIVKGITLDLILFQVEFTQETFFSHVGPEGFYLPFLANLIYIYGCE